MTVEASAQGHNSQSAIAFDDPQLAGLVELWPAFSASKRAAILALAHANID